MHVGMRMIFFIFYEASRFGENAMYMYVDDCEDCVFETSYFSGKVMHEVMHAMHVGMQLDNWIFCRALFLFPMRDCWEIS